MAELVLSLGASVDTLDQRGLTPLQLARFRKAHQIVAILEAQMTHTSEDDEDNKSDVCDDTHIPLVDPEN